MAYTRKRFVRRAKRGGYRRTRAPRPHKFVIANYAPFNEDSIGARVPDANTAPSFPFHVVQPLAFGNSDFSKTTAIIATPWSSTMFIPTTEGTTSWAPLATYNTTIIPSSKQLAIRTNCQSVRPVAHGLRIASSVPPTSATGWVHVCLFPVTLKDTTWTIPTNVASMVDMPGYQRIPLAQLTQKPVFINNQWVDDSAHEYRDPISYFQQNVDVSGGNSTGWMAILVVCDNTMVTNFANAQIEIESLVHYEALPSVASGALTVSMSAEPSKPNIMTAVANMFQYRPIVEFADAMTPTAISGAARAFSRGLAAGGLTAYGAGRAVGGIGMNRAVRWAGGAIYRGATRARQRYNLV